MDDTELLRLVADEKRRAVGFDTNSELMGQRERALNYYKGEMPDVPALPNRSQAISTDVADTIETLLPDIVEIFTGGEDVATFRPVGEEDEEAAKQETDYVNHVVFNENDGFMVLYDMFKDAMQVKLGVVTWWAEKVKKPEPRAYSGQPEAAVAMIVQDGGEPLNLRESDQGPGLYDFEIDDARERQCVKIATVPPEDFAYASDTIRVRDGTYCAMRARPRAQDLIAQGISRDIVDSLPPYGSAVNEAETNARDTVNEHESGLSAGGIGDLRQVETIAHFIRVVDDDGEPKIWRVLTGANEAVLIEKEEVGEVNYATITPYPVTHRLMGESVADKTMEPQKIRTALTRMALDSGYFALNARNEVAEEASSDNTLPDLLRNEPGMPIRSKTGNAIRPVQAGSLSFDPFGALEYFATVVEQRTGVVRNAQGMNPDTLHDTAKGAQVLMTAAQKRVRLMARIFAETGIKDMFLGVHALLRRVGGVSDTIRLRNKWVQIDPTSWGERKDMTIEIGVGSSGKEQDMMAMRAVIELQAQAVQAQGGLNGPIVKLENLYNSAIRFTEKTGAKNPEAYWAEPAKEQQGPQAPDPAMIQQMVQQAAEQSVDGQKLKLEGEKFQVQTQKDVADVQLEQQRLQLDEARLQLDAEDRAHARQLAEAKAATEAQLAASRLETETAMQLAEINAKYSTQITVAQIKADTEAFRAQADLAIQASEHQHGREMAQDQHIKDVIDGERAAEDHSGEGA